MKLLLVTLLLIAVVLSSASPRSRGTVRGDRWTRTNSSSAAAAVAASSSDDECDGDDYGTAGEFDFFVLAQSWSAEFCFSHQSYPGCEDPTDWQQNNLTMHGLWPNYNSEHSGHNWPQCCETEFDDQLDADVIKKLYKQLALYWPNEQNPNPQGDDLQDSLWAHEWAKHGVCSGLSQLDYFSLAMQMQEHPSVLTPPIITNNVGGTVQLSQLVNYYNITSGYNVGLFCTSGGGNQFLTQVTTCWTEDSQQIDCPEEVLSGGQVCSDDTIYIASF